MKSRAIGQLDLRSRPSSASAVAAAAGAPANTRRRPSARGSRAAHRSRSFRRSPRPVEAWSQLHRAPTHALMPTDANPACAIRQSRVPLDGDQYKSTTVAVHRVDPPMVRGALPGTSSRYGAHPLDAYPGRESEALGGASPIADEPGREHAQRRTDGRHARRERPVCGRRGRRLGRLAVVAWSGRAPPPAPVEPPSD